MSDGENQPAQTQAAPGPERVPLILDAALESSRAAASAAARMDDIAPTLRAVRSGLTRISITRTRSSRRCSIAPCTARIGRGCRSWQPARARAPSPEWIVDHLRAALSLAPDGDHAAAAIDSGARGVPLRVDEWKNLTQLDTQHVTAVISENPKASGGKDNVLARHPWLATTSPMVHVLLWHAVFGEAAIPDPDFHQAHVDMLCRADPVGASDAAWGRNSDSAPAAVGLPVHPSYRHA